MAMPTTTHMAADGLRLREGAKMKRNTAAFLGSIGDSTGARWERREAEDMEKSAEVILSLRMHGGTSTGPRTPDGLQRCRRAAWKHGRRSAEATRQRKEAMAIRREMRRLIAIASLTCAWKTRAP
jgi:hypothetical protein